MKHIKSYNNYFGYSERIFENNILLLSNINIKKSDYEIFSSIFNKLLKSRNIDESIYHEIRNYLDVNPINESFFNKLKDRFPKASTVSNILSDKAEEILGNLLKKAENSVSFINNISKGIKELFISTITNGKKIFTEQIINGKLKAKMEELANTEKEGLITDIKTIKELIAFYRKDFLGSFLKKYKESMSNFFSNEQEPIVENLINEEKGNVIATLIHGLEKIPPFSWLHKVSQAGEAGANRLIQELSNLTNKLGGPEFKLPVIALLIGLSLEYLLKSKAGGWLLTVLGGTTPLGMAISGIKIVASFIALIVAIDGIMSNKLLGKHH